MLKKYIAELLQDNPLNGISTYNDVLTLSTGAIIRKIKELVFDGTEEWQEYTGTNAKRYNTSPAISDGVPLSAIICSHFSFGGYTATDGHAGKITGTGSTSAFRMFFWSDINTISAWKTYLAQQYANGTPVTVWYVLATETTEQITVPTGLSGTVDGYTTQTGTPTPTNPIYPTANTVTMWANYTPSQYNGIAFVTATGQPEQYNGGWT